MAIGQMRQTVSSDQDLTQLQGALNEQFQAIGQLPILQGSYIEGVSLVTGQTNNIQHKLGRMARGYFIGSASTGALIWNDALTDAIIPLHCSANVTITLWVF